MNDFCGKVSWVKTLLIVTVTENINNIMLNVPSSVPSPEMKLTACCAKTALLDERPDDSRCALCQPRLSHGCKGGESDMLRVSVLFQLVSTPSLGKRESCACLGQKGNVSFKMDYNSYLPLKAAE